MLTADNISNKMRSEIQGKSEGNRGETVWRQASLPDVEGGILAARNGVEMFVATENSVPSDLRKVLSAGLGSPALRQAGMPDTTTEAAR